MRNASYTGWLIEPMNLQGDNEIFHVPTNSWVSILELDSIEGTYNVYDVITAPLNNFVGNGFLFDAKMP